MPRNGCGNYNRLHDDAVFGVHFGLREEKAMIRFVLINWLVLLALALSAAGFLFCGFFGAVAGVPLFLLDWSLKLGAILRELRKRGGK